MSDTLQSFILNQSEYRGLLFHANESYQTIVGLHAYPKHIAELLGKALAAVALMGHNLKQEGKLALQIESDAYIKLLITEINHRHGIRGLAQWHNDVPLPHNLIEAGKFAITLIPKQGERYQGIVPIVHQDIAKSLETYFSQSEQVFTRILLACKGKQTAGILIQKLPGEIESDLDTQTLNLILDTVQEQELLTDSNERLLHKLFHQYDINWLDTQQIHFECTCNHDKMVNAVKMLGKEDAYALLSTHKQIEVTCEFCNHHYTFNPTEIALIFQYTDET